MKIAVIGGGSTYTPELVDGLCARAEALGVSRVTLQDISAERLAVVAGFCGRMARARGASFSLDSTADLAEAVTGADFIITQIRVGGNEARKKDELLGRRHGLIGQETTGVGGFAKALRTIPAMLDICRVIETETPTATLINFTNPSGIVTEAALRHSFVHTIGLCNIPLTFHLALAEALHAAPEEVELDYTGLNHLAWVRRVYLQGEDITNRVLKELGPESGTPRLPELDYPAEFLGALAMVPMHYLRYYYRTQAMLAEQARTSGTRADEVLALESELMKLYADVNCHRKPEMLARRGGANYSRAALNLIQSIRADKKDVQIVGVKNRGTLPSLPDGAVIETRCRIRNDGARPLPCRPLEPPIAGLIHTVKAYEALTVEAAVERDYQKALLALSIHPLGPDADRAEAVLDDIIETHGSSILSA